MSPTGVRRIEFGALPREHHTDPQDTSDQLSRAVEQREASVARAVGQAVGANPVPIVVPCHRVVASDGRLTGFGGGLPAKIALLKLEGIDVDGDKPNSKVRPEVIPLDL